MKRIARFYRPFARAAAGVAALGTTLCCLSPARAYPEGAPWGAADPGAAESCSSCHYDFAAVPASAALSIDGLPDPAIRGHAYDLVVSFVDPDARVSGFQLLATSANDDAGTFRSADAAIETIGPASRSTQPATPADGFHWRLTWQAPAGDPGDVTLLLAASAANDDQSPLGDRIHYRSFHVRFGQKEQVSACCERVLVSPVRDSEYFEGVQP